MDIERIQALVQLMVQNDLSEVRIISGDERVSLKRGTTSITMVPAAPVPTALPAAVSAAQPAAAPAPTGEENLIPIPSPMVGTFYAAPSPDSPAYVSVGANVDANTVICIIEAMKVMNEIKAEVAGTIAKTLVKNGQAVEYGQPLFMVKPS